MLIDVELKEPIMFVSVPPHNLASMILHDVCMYNKSRCFVDVRFVEAQLYFLV